MPRNARSHWRGRTNPYSSYRTNAYTHRFLLVAMTPSKCLAMTAFPKHDPSKSAATKLNDQKLKKA